MKVLYVGHEPHMAAAVRAAFGGDREDFMAVAFGQPLCGLGFDLILVEEGWFEHFVTESQGNWDSKLVKRAVDYYLDTIRCRLLRGGRIVHASVCNEVTK